MNPSACNLSRGALVAALIGSLSAMGAAAEVTISGRVVDSNGAPLAQAMVSLETASSHAGPDVITVFADSEGRFRFAKPVSGVDSLTVRMLDYEPVRPVDVPAEGRAEITIVMRPRLNQADVAPASAWLADIDREDKALLVRDCIGCHQVPSREVRNYAALIASVSGAEPAEARRQSWHAIVKYMNFVSGWEFGRANPAGPQDPASTYTVGSGEEVSSIMAEHFVGAMDTLRGYEYGAPSIVNANTQILEYEVSGPNTTREAVLLGQPKELWLADVSTNRMYAVDVATGEQRFLEVPAEGDMGPHSLHRGGDGSLWITPFFSNVVARFDPARETWQTWNTTTINGEPIGIHDLSFGYKHELLTDERGRIWYSDIGNNAVGYLDPATGKAEIFRVPDVPGRSDRPPALYGLVMTADRKELWYSQLNIGMFGSFDIETLQFETAVRLPMVDAGPRRLTITEDDVMYVSLYGSGQLVEYDTKAKRQIGVYDLPDAASAPYAATWDPVRKVLWIATSNADVIYRFDPRTKAFGVLPLPRDAAFLRMIDIDPETGMLVTCYANIVEFVHGPRMALLIDPGDGAYDAAAARVERR